MKFKRAFTLIELLVVISIIAVLMSILMPALNKVREQGRKSVCSNNVRQIVMGFHTYAAGDIKGCFPLVRNYNNSAYGNYGFWDVQIIGDKLAPVESFKCPSDRFVRTQKPVWDVQKVLGIDPLTPRSYCYNMWIGGTYRELGSSTSPIVNGNYLKLRTKPGELCVISEAVRYTAIEKEYYTKRAVIGDDLTYIWADKSLTRFHTKNVLDTTGDVIIGFADGHAGIFEGYTGNMEDPRESNGFRLFKKNWRGMP